eukprot:9236339-Ditylum_brightwellii.AAC.1
MRLFCNTGDTGAIKDADKARDLVGACIIAMYVVIAVAISSMRLGCSAQCQVLQSAIQPPTP